MAERIKIVFFMSETNANGWIAGRVYIGEVNQDNITFNGSETMPYTRQLKSGVRGSFIINGEKWSQKKLENLFIQQNPDLNSAAELLGFLRSRPHMPGVPTSATLARYNEPLSQSAASYDMPQVAAMPPPSPVAPPTISDIDGEIQRENELDIAQVLLDLQSNSRGGTKRKMGGKRSKRKKSKRNKSKRR